MRLWLVLLAAVGALAGEGAVLRGPWWWHDAEGAPRLAVALRGEATAEALALEGRELAIDAVRHPYRDGEGAEAVLVLRLPRGSAGALRLRVGGQELGARLRPPLAADAQPVRLALLAAHAWPDAEDWRRLSEALGGEPHLALVLGPGAPAQLGRGGWEGGVPIAIVADDEPGLAAVGDGMPARWRHGLRLGVLGLPAAPDRAQADLAIARDLSPWIVYLDTPAGWDPALSRPRVSGAAEVAGLLAACRRLSVPLVLAGGRVGFVSEPLTVAADGALRVAAEGVRYAALCPAPGDGFARVTTDMAALAEAPLLAGLRADAGQLELVLALPEGALVLRWRREREPPLPLSALQDRLRSVPSLQEAADLLEDWLWRPGPEVLAALPDQALLARLRSEGGLRGRWLLQRLARLAWDQPTFAIPGEPDPASARAVLLQRIGAVRGKDAASWRREAAETADPWVLRALFYDLARDPERTALPALRQRVALQAAGQLPLDADPLDQHRLMHAVFDDLTASPTELRPWALALRARVDPLALGPIARFLQRHGEQRPVP
ncbi:MAG: hypothetical protein RMM29_05690 [Planctomycetota bacterium]|nr:hypothetical protein [Planctomycetota bacterium]MCX8039584.1 hypothetical protein [Planctomycetota bacterium]MDW8373125.1 hypothetical protein [Planctomycetota bacterium]